ncbi:hypothetical protein Tsp_10568 [Trichinella spiralis]|uniref:hypothetical protein n=1 Tax=Trichinella spiralis TaxID=6334 RepID=UPI0001EFD78B|nr:hypothetical protein Tsp_10568 [Trichinella spiralis]
MRSLAGKQEIQKPFIFQSLSIPERNSSSRMQECKRNMELNDDKANNSVSWIYF